MTGYNAKITNIEGKIPSITGLAINATLTAVENKIPDVISLVKKKTDHVVKITEIEDKITDHNHDKYNATPEFHTIAIEVFLFKISTSKFNNKDNNFDASSYLTLENCLFGAVKLAKIFDIDKYGYSGYGIGFDRHGSFSLPGTGLGRNVVIFEVDMSSSTMIDNKKKDFDSWKRP